MPTLLTISVGRTAPLLVPAPDGGTRQVASAIHKTRVDTALAVATLGVDGDEQADQSVHGGPDKAVYVYPAEHYPFWQTVRGQAGRPGPLPHGSLGENLTVSGLLEPAIWVGDRLRIGEVELVVTQPRTPCYKFDAHLGFAWAGKMMVQSGYTGFHCAVVRPGRLAAGDEIDIVPGERAVSIDEAHRLKNRGATSRSFLE
ncbi:MAG: MOSC domain-containing protein [Burkholderiales bacterium]|nr:MAG: MOSC domain-containing protein [Burkholderiales bacterium]RPH67668.1 MAG: MOSC domain-containing protein [Burkholderiales bacterium]